LVKVNLLRPESGGVKKMVALKFGMGGLQKILFLLSTILFLGGIILMFYTYYQKKNLSRISSQYWQAEKVKEEISALNKEKDGLISRIDLLNGYLKRELIWSERLGQLRNLIPQDAWLTELFFEKKPGKEERSSLNLRGGLMAKGNISPISILSSFVDKLKSNKEFSADFDNPVLADLRTEMKSGIETMVFSIEMPLQKEKVASLNEASNR